MLGTISTEGYTAAHIAKASAHLIRRSQGEADSLIASELAGVIGTLEDVAYLNGTGTGQPLGILDTPSINTATMTSRA